MSGPVPVDRRRAARGPVDPAAAIRAEREFLMTDAAFSV